MNEAFGASVQPAMHALAGKHPCSRYVITRQGIMIQEAGFRRVGFFRQHHRYSLFSRLILDHADQHLMGNVAERLIVSPSDRHCLLPAIVMSDHDRANALFYGQLHDAMTGFVEQVFDPEVAFPMQAFQPFGRMRPFPGFLALTENPGVVRFPLVVVLVDRFDDLANIRTNVPILLYRYSGGRKVHLAVMFRRSPIHLTACRSGSPLAEH